MALFYEGAYHKMFANVSESEGNNGGAEKLEFMST